MRAINLRIHLLSLIFFCSIMINGVAMSKELVKYEYINDVPKELILKVLDKKYYFGHQSVGDDLIKGLSETLKEKFSINLRIIGLNDSNNLNESYFMQSYIGQNENPISKSHAFRDLFNKQLNKNIDVAFFKYCYIDFNGSTNVNDVFNDYIKTINEAKEGNPNTVFIHFTTPLTTIQTGIKAKIKDLLGKPVGGVDSNIVRNRYNELLINEYSKSDLIFDLAKYQSTSKDGRRYSFTANGKKYFHLAPEYTYDGGHLNQIGRQYMAEKFLLFLVNNL